MKYLFVPCIPQNTILMGYFILKCSIEKCFPKKTNIFLELYHSEGKIKEKRGRKKKKKTIWLRASAHNQGAEINVNPSQT